MNLAYHYRAKNIIEVCSNRQKDRKDVVLFMIEQFIDSIDHSEESVYWQDVYDIIKKEMTRSPVF